MLLDDPLQQLPFLCNDLEAFVSDTNLIARTLHAQLRLNTYRNVFNLYRGLIPAGLSHSFRPLGDPLAFVFGFLRLCSMCGRRILNIRLWRLYHLYTNVRH